MENTNETTAPATTTPPAAAKPDETADVLRRLDAIERLLGRIVANLSDLAEQIEEIKFAQPDVAPAPSPASAIAPVTGDSCPKHPDAPQTKNGCTAKGCTFTAASPA